MEHDEHVPCTQFVSRHKCHAMAFSYPESIPCSGGGVVKLMKMGRMSTPCCVSDNPDIKYMHYQKLDST